MATLEELQERAKKRYQEEQEKKREQNTTQQGTSGKATIEELQQRAKNRAMEEDVKKVDATYINNFLKSYSSFFSSAEEDYKEVGWGNASAAYENKRTTAKGMDYSRQVIQKWYDSNAERLDTETRDMLSSVLGTYDKNLTSVLNTYLGAREFYSQWDTEDKYNFWDDHRTVENRQQWYTEQESRLEQLKAEKEAENARWGEVDPIMLGVESVEYQTAANEHTSKLKTINDEIAAIEAEMRNYERGNYNEDGQYYGSKVVDDYYAYSQRPDFEVDSAVRDYKNPTIEDLKLYDAYNDYSSWHYDANGVYRDAFGNELAKDEETDTWYNPMAEQYQVADKLGLFLSAGEEGVKEAYKHGFTWYDLMHEGELGGWQYLEDTEVAIYYYLLNESQESAYKYLSDMKTELNRRQMMQNRSDWSTSYDEASTLEKIALNVATVPAQLVSGVASTLENASNMVMGKDINPYSVANTGANFSNTIRSETAEDINSVNGGRIWGLTDLTGFTLGDAYQAGMSVLDSYAAIGLGGNIGGVLLASSAASSEATRLYEQGASMGQIALGSAAAGAAEMVFESVSIDKLINMKDAKTIGQVIKNALIQGGIEASEEGFTEIANILTNSIILGNQSDWAKLVEKYGGGIEGAQQAFLEKVRDVTNAAIGGFISGSVSATGPSIVSAAANLAQQQAQYANTGKAINYADGGVDALLSLANEVAGVSEGRTQKNLNRSISSVQNKASNIKVGKLYESVQKANNLANASQNQADIVTALTAKGFKAETASDIAQALIARYNGKELTKAQSRLLESVENSTVVKDVIANLVNNDKSTIGQRSQKIRDFDSDISAGIISKSFGIDTNAAKKAMEKQFTPEGTYETSVEGKALSKETNDVIDIKGVASFSEGNMMLDIGDGKTINAKDVIYASKEQALIYEAIAKMGDRVDADTANKLINQFTGGNAMVFSRGMAQAYTYGYYGLHASELMGKNSLATELTQEQRNFAYNLGKQYRNIKDQADKANARATKAAGTKGVYYRSKDGTVTDFRSYEKASNVVLKDVQKTAIDVMERMSQIMGVRFNVFESWVENGQRYYLDENGVKTAGNPNGFYDPKTGEIYIDLAAGNDYQGTMLFTVAHELTHFMRQWSPEHFTKIARIVFQHGGMKGRVSELVAAKQARAKSKGKPISYDTAMEEAVADGMETILKNGKVVEFMSDVKKTDHDAWEKIKDWFKNLAKLLKDVVSAYSVHSAQTTEGARVAAFAEDLLRQIEQIYSEGAVAAGENYQAAMENVVEKNAKAVPTDEIITDGAVVTDGEGTKFSIKSMKHDIAEGQMFEDLKTYCGWTQKQVNELRQNLNDLVEYMTPFRDILDMNESYGREGRRFSPYKPNSDPLYKISMDFSTLCSKRLLTQYVIENLQLRENRPMSAEEQMAIRAMLNEYRKVEKGLQVACAMCYVEAARLKSPQQINKWLADPETQMRNYFADKDPEFSAFIKEKQADFKESRGYARNATKKDMSAKDVRELNNIRPRLRSQYQVSAEEAKIIARAKELPNSTYLTAGNLADLSESDPVIYSAYTAFVRTATRSKSLETDEPYYYGDSRRDNGNGIIVSDSFIEAVNKENGMRFSSWSDWRIQHLLDYISAVIDNSVRGAAMHGYTKFGEEVRVLGKTGMMFNMSGVAGTQSGLNEDGSLSFSPTESIDVNEAIQLREEFPETAGLQCIGVSDAHIIALLRSDIIDYIIPYHVSGLNAALRRMADIFGWSDYTTTQHAVIDKSIKFENAVDQEHWHEEPVWSEYFVGYNTGMTGIEAMRASADRYVQMCKDRGLKPKFEQFLKEENYWKLLIDRKMINQKTGKLIQQKAVTPTFDFGTIKEVVDTYVQNYDSGLEARALNHIVENWDSIPKRIKDLKKQGGTKAKKTKKAVDTLANETLAAQSTKRSDRYWYPNMTKTEIAEVKDIAEYEAKKTDNYLGIDDKWLYNNKKGHRYFALYSTQREKITLLYACKDDRAEYEHDLLKDFLELEGGLYASFDTGSRAVSEILNSIANAYNRKNSNRSGTVGTGGNSGNAAVHSRYPGKRPSKAFLNCLENISQVQSRYGVDDHYLFAVERGDYATAQRMVDEAAEKAGYTTKGYHGSRTPGFTVVDKYSWLWFARDKVVANEYGTRTEVDNRGKPHNKNGVYTMRYNLGNNLVIYADGNSWGELPVTEDEYPGVYADEETGDITTNAMAEWAARNGYDSITFADVDDGGLTTVDVVFNPNKDAKSADPVTYDDDGNVIPLSKRFNPENEDIRYSDRDTEGKSLTAEQRAFFAQSKVRDDQGRLIPMYHGTNTPNFTVFDPQRSDDLISLFFTSDPDVANTYTQLQDKGRDIDPYNLITVNSTAEQFNAAQERVGGGLRVVKITRDWLQEMKAKAEKSATRLFGVANKYADLLAYNNSRGAFSYDIERIREITAKGIENLKQDDINKLRKAMGDAEQHSFFGTDHKGAAKEIRRIYTDNFKLFDEVWNYKVVADTPDSAIGQYTYTETNSSVPFMISRKLDFQGRIIPQTEKEAVAQALERMKWVGEHHLGNRYKVYLNITNPYVINAGKDISGVKKKVTLEYDYREEEWVIDLDDETLSFGRDEFESFAIEAFGYNTYSEIEAKILDENYNHPDQEDDNYRYVDHFIRLKNVPVSYVIPGNWNDLYDSEVADYFGWEEDTPLRTRNVTEFAKAKGYDGVIFKNMKDAGGYAFMKGRGGSTIAAAFSSEQVKSVDNKNPTADPDIRYSDRAEAVELSDSLTLFSLREEAPPKRTIKAYKVFRVSEDGKLYPPKIANLTDDESLNKPLSKDKRKGKNRVVATGNDTPVGVWINADVGGITVDENGDAILNTHGRIKVYDLNGMKADGSFDENTTLAFRPGWHLGSIPEAIQFLHKDGTMPDDLVYAECEIAADIDYQAAAMSYGVRVTGKFVHADAGLPAVPVDGYYKYKTNPKTDTHPWFISGAIKVNRIIGDAERRAICAKEGITIAPRYSGIDIEPTDIWENGQPEVAKDLTPYKKSQKNYANEQLLARTLEKIKGLSAGNPKLGYIQRELDFNSKGILDEIEKAKLDVDALRSAYEKHGFNPYYFDTDVEVGSSAKYSDRDTDSFSNRSLLANALESTAQNEIEKTKIQEYKGKISLINAEERKLHELNEKIKELSFAKGPKDTKAIRDLQFEARQTSNRINTYDKQLLRLEATKPLQDVLTREKKLAYQRAEKKGKEALEAYREKTLKTQRELLEKWQESRKKGIDSRNRTAMRHKIKDVVNELNQYLLRGTKDRHVPIELQKAVAEALDAVNMDTVGAEDRIAKLKDELLKAKTPEQIQEISRKIDHIQQMGDKMNGRLQKLKDAYDQFVNSDDPMIANSHDEVISNKLQSVIDSVGNTPLRDMNLAQLEDVYDMYRMVLTTIRNANKAFRAKKSESISTIANRVMMEVERVGGKKKLTMKGMDGVKSFIWNNLKPVYAFEHIGSDSFTEVFNSVRAGEDVWAVDVTEAREYYLDKSKKHGYNSWDFEKRYNFKSTSGMDFSLNLEQIMSLYAYSKRDQAAEHLKKGGIVIDETTEITIKNKLGFPVKFNPTEATAYNISDETLASIISKLTDEQKSFVDEMQDYLSTVMGAKGNEVSLEMYGIKLFKEKFYFPLKSAHQFMAKAKEQQKGEIKIKNSGFSKETVQKASNPIVLTPFMNVWSDHVNEMSMYHAFVLPMEDFYRVYNYKTPTSETMATESVEMFIQNAYGKGATKYIDQLLKDLNGGARTDSTTGIINKMMGLFKKGAVFASLSVVVQQPSAIARAAALVDTKYFIGPKVDHKRHKDLWDEVKQYAPVAVIKEMGYFDTNMGKSTQDFILAKEYSGFTEKMKALFTDSGYRDEALSKAPALADEIAWCGIWEAVKRETKAKYPGLDAKGEPFLKLVGSRFTEVIVKTQVYDSVLSRSGLMRSKDTGMKMATAFMAEPTTSINMIADALLQGKRGNRKYARAAIGAVIASQILNSILVSFVYAGRDDDEDETYVEKYIGTLSGEILDSLNPAGYIPFIKDIMSIVQGYDVERSDMAVISDLWNAWENLSKDYVSPYRKVEGFAGSIAQIFGLPVKNIMRDARGIYNTINSFVNGQQTTAAGIGNAVKGAITGKDVSDQQQLYEAYLSGDKVQIARVEGRYKDQSAINSAIRKALRENDPRIHDAAVARYNGNLAEYTRLAKEIIAEKHFSQDNVVAAINAEINAMDKGETSSSTPKASGLYKAEDFAVAIANGDQAMANAVKVDIIQTAQKNGKTEEEAEKSFNSSATAACKDLFLSGDISEEQAINALESYCGRTEDEAMADVQYWAFKQAYPDVYADDAWFDKYYEEVADSGIEIDVYMDYRNLVKDIDGEGKKERRMAVIHSLPITSAQKDALYYAEGWAASKLNEAPWH